MRSRWLSDPEGTLICHEQHVHLRRRVPSNNIGHSVEHLFIYRNTTGHLWCGHEFCGCDHAVYSKETHQSGNLRPCLELIEFHHDRTLLSDELSEELAHLPETAKNCDRFLGHRTAVSGRGTRDSECGNTLRKSLCFRVTAGVNVWLTCCISIDRFLIVYYHAHYLAKETRARVLGKIAAIVLAHLFPALVSNLIHYVPDAVTRYVDPLEVLVLEQIGAPKPIVYKVQVTNQVLNVARLVADRAVPWVLCPMTYLVVFVLRNQQKRAVQQSPAQGAAAFAVTEARRRAEARIRRSRKLVVGISATVFISLLPETVLDFSTYALSVDLRSRAPIVGLIWYLPNLIDPMVCIVSLPSLKRKTGMILARLGCSGFVSTMTSGTERGATIG